jgi:hypothetical protein
MIFYVELVCWNWFKVFFNWLYMDLSIVQILIVVAITIMCFLWEVVGVARVSQRASLSDAPIVELIELKWTRVSFKDSFKKS